MPHETALIAILAAGFGLAFLLGLVATRFRLPPLVGYLMAGVVIGPFTPGYVADAGLATQLAEIGVILLMFGVGLHFSIEDLFSVRKIAVPGAVAQIVAATALGAAVSHLWGWPWRAGIVFGLSLSVASTVVLLRALEERGILDTTNGRIAVGWLIVEDLATVLALVLLPALAMTLGAPAGAEATAPPPGIASQLLITLLKVAAFLALMYFVGRRTVPWLLSRVARTGSRELFTLAVLAVALGIAVGAAYLFGVSFALGAFFAGVVIAESELSYQAASDALPLQDAFAVLFFVSVGMLFDPMVIVRQPLHVLSVILIVMIGKSLAAFAIMILFRKPVHTALLISASLAQIGEFSFILAGLGITLGLLPAEANSLILAGALLTITLNPLAFSAVGPIERWLQRRPRLMARLEAADVTLSVAPPSSEAVIKDHVVLIGFGRVGRRIGYALERENIPYVAVERNQNTVEALRKRGIHAVFGDAARPGILDHVYLDRAKLLVIASPDPYHARAIVESAKRIRPDIKIAVRTHSEAGQKFLEELGVDRAFMGERELALSMAHHTLMQMGKTDDEADATVTAMRRQTTIGPAPVVN